MSIPQRALAHEAHVKVEPCLFARMMTMKSVSACCWMVE